LAAVLWIAVSDDLRFALKLADLADELTMARFRALDLRIDRKPNMTLVSDVDTAVEQRLRDAIAEARPGELVLGEEMGFEDDGSADARWILDPIDGTHNYVRGIPIFGTLIALEREGLLVASVASAPALGRRWWAARGGGAFADGRAIRVSGIAALEHAALSCTDLFDSERPGLTDRLAALGRRCWRTRGFGDFWQHCLVAEGAIEIVVEPDLALWDIAAVKLIVEEAGGRVTNFEGDPTLRPGSPLSTNGPLHDLVLAALA
jgi:histidinol-phosphatase